MASGSDNFATDRLALDWAVMTGEPSGSVSGGTYNSIEAVSGHRRTAETYTSNHYAQATIVGLGGLRDLSVRVSCSSSARSYYAGGSDPNNTGNSLYRIWRWVAGAYASLIAHVSQTPTVGDIVKLIRVGNALSLVVNGTEILAVTDDLLTGGAPGLGGGSTNVPQPLWDNWSAADVATGQPELPRETLTTTYVPRSGTTITVPAGGNVQAALTAAVQGDRIVLEAGATYIGHFNLPVKGGADYIYVEGSALASFPEGVRVSPAQAALMPKLVSPDVAPVLTASAGAHHFRFVGVEFTTTHTSQAAVHANLVALERPGGNLTLADCPYEIVFDRCYLHGTPTGSVRRGILMNTTRTAVIDSYLSDFHDLGFDSQAIGTWSGPGPFKIVNNYLEGAGENVLFGGVDQPIANLIASDIEFRNNHCFKPRSWQIGHPSYAGIPWSVKNIFELKNAQRVLIDGNTFENNWVQAQQGFAIVFTPRNQDGANPWVVVRDVTYTNNTLLNSTCGVNILGTDDIHTSEPTARILFRDNFFKDIDSRLFQMLDGPDDVTIDHNTAILGPTDSRIMTAAPARGSNNAPNFIFTNNITSHGEAGFVGDGTADGLDTLNTWFVGYTFTHNVIIGGNASLYPGVIHVPATPADVGFMDFAARDLRLAPTSPFKFGGLDGQDLGVVTAPIAVPPDPPTGLEITA